jgi:hypothetical protein
VSMFAVCLEINWADSKASEGYVATYFGILLCHELSGQVESMRYSTVRRERLESSLAWSDVAQAIGHSRQVTNK